MSSFMMNQRRFAARGFFDMGMALRFGRRLGIEVSLMCFIVGLLMMMILPGGVIAVMAQSATSQAAEPWPAVVTSEKAVARCGSSEQFYAVGKLKKGSIVRVINVNEESGWTKVNGVEGLSGFVHVKDVTITADGKKAVVSADCNGNYPNEDDPGQSWKRFKLKQGVVLRVIAQVDTDADSFWKVRLPKDASVSVPASFLRRATAEEVHAWETRGALGAEGAGEASVKAEPTAAAATDNNDNVIPKAEVEKQTGEAEGATQVEAPVETTAEVVKAPVASGESKAEVGDDVKSEVVKEDAAGAGAAGDNDKDGVKPSGEEVHQVKVESAVVKALSFGELEILYEKLKKTPILEAEIEPILEGYRRLAGDKKETSTHLRLAEVRVRLLTIRLQAQEARQRMVAALKMADYSIAKSSVAREAFLDSGLTQNLLSGRLELSNVYDGKRLPMLFRLRDVITGRTIIYVRAEVMEELRSSAGDEVTLSGRRMFDPVLGVWVLNEARVVE